MSLATPKHVERRQAASFMGGSATLPTFSTAPASRRRVDTLRVRVLSGADHALSKEAWRKAYGALLVTWMTEMMRGLHVAPDMAASRAPVSPP